MDQENRSKNEHEKRRKNNTIFSHKFRFPRKYKNKEENYCENKEKIGEKIKLVSAEVQSYEKSYIFG